MEVFIEYSALFFFGATSGWVVELFFRRFVSQKRWVNPGFMTGPIVPLYGFGLAIFYFFANVIPWENFSSFLWLNRLLEVLAAGAFMTLLEFVAGLIFIKGMHVKLWDYSKRPGNIMGIICPLFSLIWLACGALYIFLCNEAFKTGATWVGEHWQYFSLPIGVFYGAMVVDFAYSVNLATRIRKAVSESKAVASWEKIKVSFKDHLEEKRQKSNFLFAFSSKKEEFDLMVKEAMAKSKKDYEDYVAMKMAEKQAKKDAKKEKR